MRRYPRPVADILIRPARPDEIDMVGAVTEAAYRGDGFLEVEGGDDYGELLRDAGRRMEEAILLVAERDGAVVGSVTVAPAGTPWSEVARPGEVEVRMLAVDSGARRQGVAEALMAAVEDEARATGHDGVVLSTMEEQMVGAQRLYARLGYERDPARDWDIDVHMIVLRKAV